MNRNDDQHSQEEQWRILTDHFQTHTPIVARIIEATRKSMLVDYNGIQGIVHNPSYSLFSAKYEEEMQSLTREERIDRHMQQMKGQEITLRIIELDKARDHLVLSQKLQTNEEIEADRQQIQQFYQHMQPGDIYQCTVHAINPLSVIINLQGIRGWIPRNRLAPTKVVDPRTVLQIGQEIEVMVLEKKKGFITCSLLHAQLQAQLLPTLHSGDTRTGTICTLSDEGIYVDLGGPLGLIPTENVVYGYITHPADLFHQGQELMVKIEQITTDEKIILALIKEL
jgi:ribosomal protein S1